MTSTQASAKMNLALRTQTRLGGLKNLLLHPIAPFRAASEIKSFVNRPNDLSFYDVRVSIAPTGLTVKQLTDKHIHFEAGKFPDHLEIDFNPGTKTAAFYQKALLQAGVTELSFAHDMERKDIRKMLRSLTFNTVEGVNRIFKKNAFSLEHEGEIKNNEHIFGIPIELWPVWVTIAIPLLIIGTVLLTAAIPFIGLYLIFKDPKQFINDIFKHSSSSRGLGEPYDPNNDPTMYK